ncbi:ATP-binding protein [Kineococcus aurantiacus]|uniref:Signal transduction histidine kinase n=1 Tax=Kineococcus aurantiacus TaxID=37633 RepID=A0A7Y9DN77_9ACTN|nr:ATP-binding protein [Kineococcus aurantiacus]NYD23717.1 signal transduction histidine kinase [Kineococcus aurantiacus]
MCSQTPAAALDLVMDATASRRARRFLDEHWCTVHAASARPQADLVVTELVSNAVRHGAPPATLTLDCAGAAGVTVGVSDADPHAPTLRHVTPDALGGRGIALVDVLSEDWGVDPHPGGKTVWSRILGDVPGDVPGGEELPAR